MILDNSNGHWPVNWTGVFVGALAAIAMALVTGLAAVAIGAQLVGHGQHVVSWGKVQFGGIFGPVLAAFFSLVVAGWVSERSPATRGLRRRCSTAQSPGSS